MKIMTAEELRERLNKGDVCLIDVREPGEYKTECIDEACLIPLGEFSADKLPSTDKAIVIHCRSGRRSADACAKLLQEKPDLEVYNLEGGILAWMESGHKVKKQGSNVLPLDRQTQILAGSMSLLGVVLGFLVHPGFFGLSAFVGAGLITAGVTGWCGSTQLLAKMPWNK